MNGDNSTTVTILTESLVLSYLLRRGVVLYRDVLNSVSTCIA